MTFWKLRRVDGIIGRMQEIDLREKLLRYPVPEELTPDATSRYTKGVKIRPEEQHWSIFRDLCSSGHSDQLNKPWIIRSVASSSSSPLAIRV